MNCKRKVVVGRAGLTPCRCLLVGLLLVSGGLFFSCASGRYMATSPTEKVEVLGTVQSTFAISGSFRYRSAINTQAYITLLAEAQKKYPDAVVDVRDITWVIGKQLTETNNFEYTALGKVVRLP